MTDSNAFFRALWRFNALVIALAALGALAMIASWLVPRSIVSAGVPDNYLPAPTSVETPPRLELGSFVALAGTPFFYARLGGVDKEKATVGRSSAGVTRNVVIFDTRDGATRSLLANNVQSVSEIARLPAETPYTARQSPVRALFVQVYHGDTDAEPAFAKQFLDVILFSPDGSRRLDVVHGARTAYRVEDPNEGEVFIFAVGADGRRHYYDVDFTTLEIRKSGEVAEFPSESVPGTLATPR